MVTTIQVSEQLVDTLKMRKQYDKESYEEVKISEEDERQILELATDPKVFEKMAASIAPSIWGYEEMKRALVLQMFSGVRKIILFSVQ